MLFMGVASEIEKTRVALSGLRPEIAVFTFSQSEKAYIE